MATYRFHPRRAPHSAALDAGLPVRLPAPDRQATIFSGVPSLSVQELSSELSLLVSHLRVRSFGLRTAFEAVTSALLHNVRGGFWLQAREVALDLCGLFGQARRGRFADPESCLRGASGAMRLADLCWQEVR